MRRVRVGGDEKWHSINTSSTIHPLMNLSRSSRERPCWDCREGQPRWKRGGGQVKRDRNLVCLDENPRSRSWVGSRSNSILNNTGILVCPFIRHVIVCRAGKP